MALCLLRVAEPLCGGRGYGPSKLLEAEDEARPKGCRVIFPNTFSFRTCPSYERLGYEVIADVPDRPSGHTYHLSKRLPSQPN